MSSTTLFKINLTKLFLSLVILFLIDFSVHAQVEQWEIEADTLMSQQQFEKAAALYSKVIDTRGLKAKDDYRTHYKRAFAYYYSGKFDTALKDVDLFLTEYSQVAQAHLLRAFIFRESGNVDEQLESVGKAIAIQPENLELIKWRGTLFLQENEFSKAKSDFLSIRDSLADAALETNLALAYYSLNDLDSALVAVNKSIELDATYEPAYLYGGSFCIETENFAKGLEYLNLALLVNSKNETAMFYKGVALLEMKRETEGCQFLARAFRAGHDDAAEYLKERCYDIYK